MVFLTQLAILDWPDFEDVADLHDEQMDICPTCACECELNGDAQCYECQIAPEPEDDDEPVEVRLLGGYDTQSVAERNRMRRFLA